MTIPKLLAQLSPAASTLTMLYRAPSCANVKADNLIVCNRSGTATTFRVAISPKGAADAGAHYICYDFALAGNDTHTAALDLRLTENDEVRIYTPSTNVSFHLFGAEAF